MALAPLPDTTGVMIASPDSKTNWPSGYAFFENFVGLHDYHHALFGPLSSKRKQASTRRKAFSALFPLVTVTEKFSGGTQRRAIVEIERAPPAIWRCFCSLGYDTAGSYASFRAWLGDVDKLSVASTLIGHELPWPKDDQQVARASRGQGLGFDRELALCGGPYPSLSSAPSPSFDSLNTPSPAASTSASPSFNMFDDTNVGFNTMAPGHFSDAPDPFGTLFLGSSSSLPFDNSQYNPDIDAVIPPPNFPIPASQITLDITYDSIPTTQITD